MVEELRLEARGRGRPLEGAGREVDGDLVSIVS